jgi:succinyl-diaminopimelate desuccinylase
MPGIRLEIRRLLLSHALRPLPGSERLVESLQRNGRWPCWAGDRRPRARRCMRMRACMASGIPAVLYGAGPRTVPESNAKKADEKLALEDLRKATKVVALTLLDFLKA